MQRIGKSRIVLALVAIAFLLFNPAGICAGTPSSQSPSHPCCPSTPAPGHQAPAPSSCVCIDRQPAAPSLPSLTDEGPVAAIAPDQAALLYMDGPAGEDAAWDTAVPLPQDRLVQFHQLLL